MIDSSLKVTLNLEAVVQRCSTTNDFLKTPMVECLFNKAAEWKLVILLEKIHSVFSCEFCKISENTFFKEHPRMCKLPISPHRIIPTNVTSW